MRVTEVSSSGPVRVRVGDDGRVTLRVPIAVKQRSSHKRIIGPSALDQPAAPLKLTPFQLALARGYRWLEMLESSAAASMKEIARCEKVDPSLVSRAINLTTLDPAIVQAILDDTLPERITLLDVAIDSPLDWSDQQAS